MSNPFAREGGDPYRNGPFALVLLPADCVSARLIAAHLIQARSVLPVDIVSWATDVLNDPNRRIVYAVLGHPSPQHDDVRVKEVAAKLRAAAPELGPEPPLELSSEGLAAAAPNESTDDLPRLPLVPLGRRFAPPPTWSLCRYALEQAQ
jgi:hypothetical protein